MQLRTAHKAALACLLGAATALACGRDIVVTPTSSLAKSGDSTDTTPVAQPVTHFNLTVIALGTGIAPDTAEATPVPRATLTLTRLATASGDTVTSDADAGAAIADASGHAYFAAVPTGYFYLLRSIPPAGSPYQASSFRFAPSPYSDALTIKAWMHRAP